MNSMLKSTIDDAQMRMRGTMEDAYLEVLADMYNYNPDGFENAMHRLRIANNVIMNDAMYILRNMGNIK